MARVVDRDGHLALVWHDADGVLAERPTDLVSAVPEDRSRAERALAEIVRGVRLDRAKRRRAAQRMTLRRYAATWLAARETRGVRSVACDRSRLRRHILPRLGDRRIGAITPDDVRELLLDLRDASRLAPRTIRNVHRTLSTLYRDAIRARVIKESPVLIEQGVLPKTRDADPMWRAGALFTGGELLQIITGEIDLGHRVIWALMFLAGLRPGEAFAARWDCLLPAETLDCLLVARAYSTACAIEGRTKTDAVRRVPIHPYLRRLLELWRAEWLVRWGRNPSCAPAAPDGTPRADLIIPAPDSTGTSHWSTDTFLRARHADLERLGLRRRRAHDARRTFVTIAREHSDRDQVRRLTHARPAEEFDQYEEQLWPVSVAVIRGMVLPGLGDDREDDR